MDKKSKLISGLTSRKLVRKTSKHFTDSEKHIIIQELLKTGCTKRDIWEKYTGQQEEHGQIIKWMRKLGYDNSTPKRRSNFVIESNQMEKNKETRESIDSFENLQLKKKDRIA